MMKNMNSELLEWGKAILFAVVLGLLITQIIRPTLVSGDSMLPTLDDGDYLIIYRLAYALDDPEPGDVVVFHTDLTTTDGIKKDLIKRVIAVPGDRIIIEGGEVYVNGDLLDEDYIYEDQTRGTVDMLIPEGYIFVMGDNRGVSLDSRNPSVGLVPVEEILGKVVLRLFPFNKFGSIYTE